MTRICFGSIFSVQTKNTHFTICHWSDSLFNEAVPADQQDEFDLFTSPPRKTTRKFLGWDRPLLDLASDYFTDHWESGPLDLSHLIVIVPTRNASRRLRESLAIRAAQKNTGALPPLILNPDDLLIPPSAALSTASKAETLAAWIGTLLEAPSRAFPALFPVPPMQQDFAWALSSAKELMGVQSLLGEGAHNASYASKVLTSKDLEPERWQDFAKLEQTVFAKLEKQGRQPRSSARRQAIDSWKPAKDYQRLILLGLPDPPPALEPLLERVAQTMTVEVLIHAPEEESDLFDWLGKPTEDWSERCLRIPDENIFQCLSPSEQAERASERVAVHSSPHQLAAIGVPDPEVVAPLRKSLAARHIPAFDPAGEPLSQQGICHLLRSLRDWMSSRRLASLRELLRLPGVAEAAGSFQVPEGKSPFAPDTLLEAFDRFHEAHLSETLSDAQSVLENVDSRIIAPVTRTLQWAEHHLRNLQQQELAQSLPLFLSGVYQHVSITNQEEFDSVTQILNQVLAEVASLALPSESGHESFQLFLTLLEEQVLASKRPAEAIELPGWLELPWEDAPHVILTGCNDGLVPESIQGHPWLPNEARLALGLRHNASRQARDSYLMAALLASRTVEGQVDLFFGRVNEQNDPLRPSRLLLATATTELPERVNLLFQENESSSAPLPWNLAWQLTPPKPDPERFQKLSVTSFSSYLDCPFRYYLQFGLRMREPDLERMELNPRDYGTLTHDVLEDFAATTAASSDCAKDIAACFQDLLTSKLAERYGPHLSAPLLIQANSIRQRLAWWAEHEARQRAEGWTILETETDLAPDDDPFLLGGMMIRGKIDRIESHPDYGLRILDFKTKKKPTPVIKAHLRSPKRSEEPNGFPSWKLTNLKGKAQVWTNLQIPLYLLALASRFPQQECVSGYVQLGATKGDVHLDLWQALDEELLESARLCALGVIENIQNHHFWPPAERPHYDNFAALLFGDPEAAIDPQNLITADQS